MYSLSCILLCCLFYEHIRNIASLLVGLLRIYRSFLYSVWTVQLHILGNGQSLPVSFGCLTDSGSAHMIKYIVFNIICFFIMAICYHNWIVILCIWMVFSKIKTLHIHHLLITYTYISSTNNLYGCCKQTTLFIPNKDNNICSISNKKNLYYH